MKTRLPALAVLLCLATLTAAAQDIPIFREEIDLEFDRPEAWVMKYFAAAILPSDFSDDIDAEPWSLTRVSLELGWLPHLDEQQRTVGFNGIKEEDLNKLPVLPRPSLSFRLPRATTLTIGWIPPIELEGVTANLVSLSASKPILQRGPWGLEGRIAGQTGTIESDFTCPASVVSQPPGSPGNVWGCEAASLDRYSIDQAAAEATITRVLQTLGSPEIRLSAAGVWIDGEFQVDAVRAGFRDLTLLKADGLFWTGSLGALWRAPRNLEVGIVATWAPIDVRRPGESVETDPFFNLRLLLHRRM